MHLVVRTPTTRGGRTRVRRQLAVPFELDPPSIPTTVWWIEHLSGHDYLRLCGAPTERSRRDSPDRVVYRAADGFELVSRPGGRSSSAVDVSSLFPSSEPLGVEVDHRAAEDVIQALGRARAAAARTAITRSFAEAGMRARLRSRRWPRVRNLTEAQRVIRSEFATEELIRPAGEDPHAFAARILLASMPRGRAATFSTLSSKAIRQLPGGIPMSTDTEPRTEEHQALLRRLVGAIESHGLQATYNVFVDARVTGGGRQLLFEVKSADVGSFSDQLRLSVGQLLEYRYRFGHMTERTDLCVVITDVPVLRWAAHQFLESIGIMLVVADRRGLHGLERVLEPYRSG